MEEQQKLSLVVISLREVKPILASPLVTGDGAPEHSDCQQNCSQSGFSRLFCFLPLSSCPEMSWTPAEMLAAQHWRRFSANVSKKLANYIADHNIWTRFVPSETLTLLAVTQKHTDIKREPISRLLASAGVGGSSLSVGDPLGPPQARVGSPLPTLGSTLPPAGRAVRRLFDMFSWPRRRGGRFSSCSPALFRVCLERFLLDGALRCWFFGRSARCHGVWVPRSAGRFFPATLLIWFSHSPPLGSVSFCAVLPSRRCFAFFTATVHQALAAASLPDFRFFRLRFDFGRFFDLDLALQCFLHFLWNHALAIGGRSAASV